MEILGRGDPGDGIPGLPFVRTVQKRQGLIIGAPEEISWRLGFLTDDELRARAEPLVKSGYGSYLLGLLEI